MNVLTELKERFRAAIRPYPGPAEELLAMIRPSQNPQFGDYQANMAMPLGKQLGKPPRDVAAEIVASLAIDDICESPEVAGPGFVNLTLRDNWLQSRLEAARHDERLACPITTTPRTFVVDFSSPNVAKPLHVGHIRSTVIGDALCRLLRFQGHHVISDNHLGDWGTQFGMIIYGYRHFVDPQAYQERPIDELGRLYKLVRRLMDHQQGRQSLPDRKLAVEQLTERVEQLVSELPDSDPRQEKKRQKVIAKARADVQSAQGSLANVQASLAADEADDRLAPLLAEHAHIAAAVLEETAQLHQGAPYQRALWEEFLPKCRAAIQEIYERLDVRFDVELGESFYHDHLQGVVDSLGRAGLARESQGAICVFLDRFATPFIIQKQDGAFLYATSDLATIQYRLAEWHPDAMLYVVDFRQSEHFDKLFATARLWGASETELQHIKFGTVLGEDGKPYKTRSGDTVGLVGLLDEAETRAYEVVSANDDAKANGWELDEPARRRVARVVGIAALKYADLSQNRESDYVFSYDRMLALQGNTATYMQYSYARVHGIFTRGKVDVQKLRASSAAIKLAHPTERALGLKILQFGDAVDEVLVDYRPNLLTAYLFELAKSFSGFFEQCPVLKAETDEQRMSRLLLCDLTARTLKLGLELLGIQTVEKM